jgi:hypothetical protein
MFAYVKLHFSNNLNLDQSLLVFVPNVLHKPLKEVQQHQNAPGNTFECISPFHF